MQANTRNPFELFGHQVRYVVPLFQRPYVWNREQQWEPLWVDIRTEAESVFEAGPSATALPAHFLGAIVLDQQWGPAGYIGVRHIIDGQQRLTTLQLLLDAAQLVTSQYGEERDANALKGLILNNPAIAQDTDELFKVWPTNYDRPSFRSAMDDKKGIEGDLAKHPIARAHNYFVDAITEWAEVEGDPDKVKSRLSALGRTLMHHLKLVVIDLESGDNAQVIFESLNHRGTPLLAADLVKNRVFQVALAQGADVETIYHEKWETFDSDRWRRKIRRGRLSRPRIDVFLYYWLAMKKQSLIAEDRLFTEFDSLVQQAPDITGLIDDFVRSAEVYDRLEEFAPFSVEGTFTYRVLDTLEAHVWGPVLLWLFGWDEASLPTEQRHLALRAIESWMVRRTVCRLTTKAFNKVMADLLQTLEESGPEGAGSAVVEYLASSEAESEMWPSDEMVKQALRTELLYPRLKRARLRMILEALEDDHRSTKTEEVHCLRGKLTIEHVLPQGWREHWKLPAGEPAAVELRAAQRDQLLHTIGNLTLVTSRLNPELSNRPWRDAEASGLGQGDNKGRGKRSILSDHSVLFLNKRIVDGWPDEWSEQSILDRGDALTERFLQIWRVPDDIAEE